MEGDRLEVLRRLSLAVATCRKVRAGVAPHELRVREDGGYGGVQAQGLQAVPHIQEVVHDDDGVPLLPIKDGGLLR